MTESLNEGRHEAPETEAPPMELDNQGDLSPVTQPDEKGSPEKEDLADPYGYIRKADDFVDHLNLSPSLELKVAQYRKYIIAFAGFLLSAGNGIQFLIDNHLLPTGVTGGLAIGIPYVTSELVRRIANLDEDEDQDFQSKEEPRPSPRERPTEDVAEPELE